MGTRRNGVEVRSQLGLWWFFESNGLVPEPGECLDGVLGPEVLVNSGCGSCHLGDAERVERMVGKFGRGWGFSLEAEGRHDGCDGLHVELILLSLLLVGQVYAEQVVGRQYTYI